MQPAETQRKKQQGKAQVVRVSEEAHARRRAGQTLRMIFEDLTARGEITIPMRTFTRWVTRLESDTAYQPLSATPQQIPTLQGELTSRRRAGGSNNPAQSPATTTPRQGPRHGIVGVQRPKPINTTINPDELY